MEEKITIKTIDKLCDLSKLQYNLEEKEKLVIEVNNIIDMISQCDNVQVDDTIKENFQNIRDTRSDECLDDNKLDNVFDSTTNVRQNYFAVPKVVD